MTNSAAGTLIPHMDTLPADQLQLWPQLQGATRLGFVLYGGTAIALRLGHRTSVDFDFFSEKPLDRERLHAAMSFMARSTTLQDAPDTLTVLTQGHGSASTPVKLSFFAGLDFGRVGTPDRSDDGVLQIASCADLLATKLKVLMQRVEAKDYRDIAALMTAGASLPNALAAASAMFGTAFQPSECLKAMTYFEGGDLHGLNIAEKTTLVQAVCQVRELPLAPPLTRELGTTWQ